MTLLYTFLPSRKHVDLKAFAYASTVVTEPVVTEPVVTETVVTEPVVTELVVTEQKMRTSSKYVDAEN